MYKEYHPEYFKRWHLMSDRLSLRINPLYIEIYLAFIGQIFDKYLADRKHIWLLWPYISSLYLLERRHIWPIENICLLFFIGHHYTCLADMTHIWLILAENREYWPIGHNSGLCEWYIANMWHIWPISGYKETYLRDVSHILSISKQYSNTKQICHISCNVSSFVYYMAHMSVMWIRYSSHLFNTPNFFSIYSTYGSYLFNDSLTHISSI